MTANFSHLPRKMGALLCAALILVFTQAAVASAVGDVEHLFVGKHAHHHMLFSDITIHFQHDAQDGDGAHHDLGQKAPAHHHHGDLGSSSALPISSPDALPQQINLVEPPVPVSGLTKTRLDLPERPPRTGHIAS